MKVCNVMATMPPSGIFCDIIARMGDIGTDVTACAPPADYDLYVYWRGHWTPAVNIISPSVNYVHCDLTDDIPFDIGLQSYENISKYDYHLCICEKQKNDLMDFGVDASKIKIIHHGYDPKLLSVVRTPSSKVRIGFFSNRYDRLVKGEIELYRLVREHLVPYRNNIEWHWCGIGRAVEDLVAREYGYSSQLIAATSYDELIDAYKNIDILLILSEAEGGPAVFPEALAAGACVLSTRVGMVSDCGYGMSLKDIKDKLIAYVSGAEIIPTQEQVRSALPVNTWDTQITRYKDFYSEILS